MVAALPTFSDFRATSAATLPCTRSLWAVRRYPSKSGPRSAAVSFGAVLDGETVTMPAFHKIGAPGTASLLQLLPIAATTSWLEASLVAAVTPPSALQPESSPISLIGNPMMAFLRSEEHTSELQSPYDLVCR